MLVTVTGAVRRRGLFEVECGRTLRHIVFELAEGMSDGAAFAGVRVGATGEPVIGEAQLDLPLDYESLSEVSVKLGPAGVEVLARIAPRSG
jgi:NADH:ubiquinone oxidoreductase subunit F (NADH-binding)